LNTVSDTPQKNPNPQGKGLVPILQDWASLQTGTLGPKTPAAFLRDYCMSSLALTATFRFKPVIGKPYFLYAGDRNWMLSMIAPGEWGQNAPGDFVANCCLRPDMTWHMDVSELKEGSVAAAKAREYIQEFLTGLSEQDSISQSLPFYVRKLPYYPRMLAAALSSSLKQSLPPSGDNVKALLAGQSTFSLLVNEEPDSPALE
jgi:hypothetical protein